MAGVELTLEELKELCPERDWRREGSECLVGKLSWQEAEFCAHSLVVTTHANQSLWNLTIGGDAGALVVGEATKAGFNRFLCDIGEKRVQYPDAVFRSLELPKDSSEISAILVSSHWSVCSLSSDITVVPMELFIRHLDLAALQCAYIVPQLRCSDCALGRCADDDVRLPLSSFSLEAIERFPIPLRAVRFDAPGL